MKYNENMGGENRSVLIAFLTVIGLCIMILGGALL